MRKYLVLFAVLAVVLTACRIESNITLDIEEDGSAVVGAEIGLDEAIQNLLGDMGEGSLEDLFEGLPDLGGVNVEPMQRTEGDMTYYGVTRAVEDLSAVDASSAVGEVFETFSYTFDEDTATLTAAVAPTGLGDVGGDLPIDPSMITDEFFSANVIVSMPGNVTSHDADEVRSDGTLVWKIPLTGSKTISATSDLGSGGTSNLILIALVVLLVAAAIAIVVVSIMNRRRSQAAVDSAAASHSAEMAAAAMVAEGGPVEPGEPDALVADVIDDRVEASSTAPLDDTITMDVHDAEAPADPVDTDSGDGGVEDRGPDEGDQPDRT